MNTNIKFVKWVVDKKETKCGDLLVKAEFSDNFGKLYEWYPKRDDLQKGIASVDTSSEMNKLRRKK
jgi:hypothetical protein